MAQKTKDLADKAKALAAYWADKKDFHKAQEASSVYALTAWKGGVLLGGLERNERARTDLQLPATVNGSPYARTLEAANLSESTAKRFIAAITALATPPPDKRQWRLLWHSRSPSMAGIENQVS